jgi:hypothetical protein
MAPPSIIISLILLVFRHYLILHTGEYHFPWAPFASSALSPLHTFDSVVLAPTSSQSALGLPTFQC